MCADQQVRWPSQGPQGLRSGPLGATPVTTIDAPVLEVGPPAHAPAPRRASPAVQPTGSRYWQSVLRFGLAGNTVQPLIDGPDSFAAIQRTIQSAESDQHFVYLLAWWCDPWVNLTGPGTSLLDLFGRAAQRGVQIRVLLWEPPQVVYPNHARLHSEAVRALNRIPNCHAQQDDAGLTKSHHQKLLIVRGRDGLVALCGGVDVNVDRIHRLPPPRGAVRADRPPTLGWIGGSGGSGSDAAGSGEPLHDVHARLSGPTAKPLLRVFLRRWWARSGDRGIDRRAPLRGRFADPVPSPTGRQFVRQFVRIGETFSGLMRPTDGGRPGRRRAVTVQDIWLRSILAARRFIYMEEQYLTSLCAAEAIRSVLPRLQHVMILIPPSEITDLPGRWRRRREFIERITRQNSHAAKLHVYTRVLRPAQSCRRTGGPHLYVHSKMAVIDDELMLIGSANCNNRGWESDSELVLASFEEVRPGQVSTAQRLRMALWSHHLDQPAANVRDAVLSRALWDSAPTRHVCRYVATAGSDGGIALPDRIVDPPDRRPTDPCCTLLRICP
jgi:phosphatidylserine/phosphatidylglycerophosphate/cardiolipin synthase-like enzyme